MEQNEDKLIEQEPSFSKFSPRSPSKRNGFSRENTSNRRDHHHKHSHRHRHRRRRDSPARKRMKRSDSFEANRKNRMLRHKTAFKLQDDFDFDKVSDSFIHLCKKSSVGIQASTSQDAYSQTISTDSFVDDERFPAGDHLFNAEAQILKRKNNFSLVSSTGANGDVAVATATQFNETEVFFSDSSDDEMIENRSSVSSPPCSIDFSSSSDFATSDEECQYGSWILSYDQPQVTITDQPKALENLYSKLSMDDITETEKEDGFFVSRKRAAASPVSLNQQNHFACCCFLQFSSWINRLISSKRSETSSGLQWTNPQDLMRRRFAELGHLISFGGQEPVQLIKPKPVIIRTRSRSILRVFQYHLRKMADFISCLLCCMISSRKKHQSSLHMV